MTRLVYGVGINDVPRSASKRNPIYTAWYGMLTRCFSRTYQEKWPTYISCTVCDEWLRLSNFSAWALGQEFEGMSLDKDILIAGNKHYCPEACVFVPAWLNIFISNMKAKPRGNMPMGVQQYGKRFVARFGCRDTAIYLGSFSSASAAHSAYMAARKVEVAKRIAEYDSMPFSDPEVTQALVRFFGKDI